METLLQLQAMEERIKNLEEEIFQRLRVIEKMLVKDTVTALIYEISGQNIEPEQKQTQVDHG